MLPLQCPSGNAQDVKQKRSIHCQKSRYFFQPSCRKTLSDRTNRLACSLGNSGILLRHMSTIMRQMSARTLMAALKIFARSDDFGGASFSLQPGLQPRSGRRLKPALQAQARSTTIWFAAEPRCATILPNPTAREIGTLLLMRVRGRRRRPGAGLGQFSFAVESKNQQPRLLLCRRGPRGTGLAWTLRTSIAAHQRDVLLSIH
jgi:hypothetical protein